MDKQEVWTISRILQWTEQYFRLKGIESSRLDGEVLLSHVLGLSRIQLYTDYARPLERGELDAFRPLVQERIKGKSVAAIIGKKEFMGLEFIVNEHVLIPRPDTETLVEDILSLYKKDDTIGILDMCTGPGTILLSLLHYLPSAIGVGVDISEQAIDTAEKNRKRFSLEERAQFIVSDLFSQLDQPMCNGNFSQVGNQFDVIVSNPPYIRNEDKIKLAPEVLHEPHIALFGGDDGLDFYRMILKDAVPYLKVGGYLAVEIGEGQEADIAAIAKEIGVYSNVVYNKDIANKVRELRWQKVRE